jgi:hypothetical protein
VTARRLALTALLAPTRALAHAGERMVILTLPSGRYMLGAALAVALTALAGALAPRLPRLRPLALFRLPDIPAQLGSWCSAATVLALVVLGVFGPRDPLGNLLPLTVWTFVAVALPLASLALGNLWAAIDPWTGPATALRRFLGWNRSLGLAHLGHLPACAGLFALAWFEIVALAPNDPAVLARVTLLYWLAYLALATLEGPAWLARGEALTVYLGFVATIAPLWRERGRLMLGAPGARIVAMPGLAPTAVAFVALMLASVSFDGLRDTFRWLAFLGINPLEFPGRSVVVRANTLGLAAAWALTLAIILAAVALGRRLAGARGRFWAEAGPAMLAFLPIAAGYHAAHYLTALLGSGQYLIAALNDPLASGASLLGLPHHWVSFAFLTDPASVTAIWNAQFALILCAHLLAVLIGLRLAGPRPAIAHLPMTALMVAYTVFGLWLLAAPTGA